MSMATLPEKVNSSRLGWSVSVYLVGLTFFGSMTAFDSVIVVLSVEWFATVSGAPDQVPVDWAPASDWMRYVGMLLCGHGYCN